MIGPALTAVVVTWNGRELLATCLKHLLPQLGPDDQLLVVDNGSHDDTVAWLATQVPRARCIALTSNVGFSPAMELALRDITTPWVLTINNDAWPETGAVATLRRAAAEAEEGVGALQPLMVLARTPPRVNSTGIVLDTKGAAWDRNIGHDPETIAPARDVFGATAGAALYRMSMLEALRLPSGIFDPAFFMYFEDVDLAWRARLAGWQTHYVGSARIQHRLQASSDRRDKHFIARQCVCNRVRCLLKNGSWTFVVKSARRTVGEFLWYLRHGGGRALATWAEAAWDAWRQRGAVAALATCSRRAVEEAWLAQPPDRFDLPAAG